MKKLLVLFYISNLFSAAVNAQYKGEIDKSKIPATQLHYQAEYTFDTTVNPAAWATQKKGLHVSFASTDQLYFRSEVPDLKNETFTWTETGWKGERLNTQILVWSPDTLEQVRFILSDLQNVKGSVISKNNFKLNLVRYVVSNYPYGIKDATCGASPYKNLYLMPDRFESFDRFDLPGKTLRPVWLSIDIPANTEIGLYKGFIEVRTGSYTTKLELNITVQNQLLPKPSEWKHRLDLWQNPWVIAWRNGLEPWSDDHKVMLKKHMKLYADAGGTFITTYAVHSPWSDNSYMIEGTMIDWKKTKEGTWRFDYRIFDEYVQLCMDLGINEAITIYTPVPWGFRFRYLDEETGAYVHESWPPDSKEFKTVWNLFLTDLQKHLEQRGWFEKTYLGINENEMAHTLAALKVIKAHSAKWRITYAGNWHKELDGLLDDYCFLYGEEATVDSVQMRSARKQTTTWYVCCNPPVPNNFVFSPPVEGRWMGWYSSAHKYDGFLRWAYDAWPGDVLRDARHEYWPAGDCYLVYPGGNSCIRFEKLREGIVDFEKIRILRDKAASSKDKTVKDLLKQLDIHMNLFLKEKDFDTQKITADVTKGRKLLEMLSEKMKDE